jgi:GNAT superfamily N-acetyltransferase
MKLNRTKSDDADFRRLVVDLDAYLADMDGDEHAYYAQFNGIDSIPNVVVVYEADMAVGCGAIKRYSEQIAEVKRMFVRREYRGRRVGALILAELETWARELGYEETVLETGHKQTAAIRLYSGSGYNVIPNYDQYANVENSVCMKKRIALDQDAAV